MQQSQRGAAPIPPWPTPGALSWAAGLIAQRSVRIALVAWLVANVALLVIGRGGLPFDRPVLPSASAQTQVVSANAALIEVLLLMGIVWALTRTRRLPDIAARAPAPATARRETLLLLGWGALGLLGGWILGRALGWHAFAFHVVGTLYGTHQTVAPAEVVVWAIYNVVVYAVLPYWFFHRRYSNTELNLTSSNRRNDALVIVVVLAIESLAQLLAVSAAILSLSPRQLAFGAPLTFGLYFLGTVLPTMIFITCILVPRYLTLTGSAATTVILGGLTYAVMHIWDGWTAFTSPRTVALSLIVLFMTYFGPGMMKTFLTLRTGNAWVHVWAYHAIAPHTLQDTPRMVRVFGIK